ATCTSAAAENSAPTRALSRQSADQRFRWTIPHYQPIGEPRTKRRRDPTKTALAIWLKRRSGCCFCLLGSSLESCSWRPWRSCFSMPIFGTCVVSWKGSLESNASGLASIHVVQKALDDLENPARRVDAVAAGARARHFCACDHSSDLNRPGGRF